MSLVYSDGKFAGHKPAGNTGNRINDVKLLTIKIRQPIVNCQMQM